MPEIAESVPKYLQIAQYLRDQILRGDLRPGDAVPSERRLADDWTVSRPTAARTLEALRQEGLVEKRQGSGTFVRAQLVHRQARERYGRARETGRIYAPGEYAVITETGLVEAPNHVVEGLSLGKARIAAVRRRVTHGPEGPAEMSASWFTRETARQAPRLLEAERILEGTLMYVETATQREASRAQKRGCARLASAEEIDVLGLDGPWAAVLVVHHTVYDRRDRPLEFSEAIYPQGAWAFEQAFALG